MKIVNKLTVTLTEEEEAKIREVGDLIHEICSNSLECCGCPLRDFCDFKFTPNTILNIADALTKEGE